MKFYFVTNDLKNKNRKSKCSVNVDEDAIFLSIQKFRTSMNSAHDDNFGAMSDRC